MRSEEGKSIQSIRAMYSDGMKRVGGNFEEYQHRLRTAESITPVPVKMKEILPSNGRGHEISLKLRSVNKQASLSGE